MSISWDNLAEIRKSRGISLQQIVNSTRISRYYLRAIESGDFKKLPGGVYNASYLRQYAEAISLDGDEVVAAYKQQVGSVDEVAKPARKPAAGKLESLIGWIFSPAAGSHERAG